MVCCFVPGCSHKSDVQGCKMFRFPSSPMKRLKWKRLIRRKDCSPKQSSRVCSCHFADGKKGSLPEVDLKSSKRMHFKSPEKKHRSKHFTQKETEPESSEITEPHHLGEEPDINAAEVNPDNERGFKSDVSAMESAHLKEEVESLRKELENAKSQNVMLSAEVYFRKKQLEESKKIKPFNVSMIAKEISHFSGLPSIEVFNLLLSLFDDQPLSYYYDWNVECLSKSYQLLMTLMKLRRNISNLDLAVRFGVSKSTVSNVVITFIFALHEILVKGLMDTIPSRRKNQNSMPKVFSEYSSCRIVLDCTEVYTAAPKRMNTQNAMYSDYKHRITMKGLVGIAPNGTVTYVSELFPGSTSDKIIVEKSDLLDQFRARDFVMADKGFLIGDILPPGVTLNIPPFKTTPQFTPSQVATTLRGFRTFQRGA